MDQVIIDYETRSGCSIDYGLHNYFHDRRAAIMCMAYKINDNPTRLWLPGLPVPDIFGVKYRVYAHNLEFEFLCNKILGPKYGIPMIDPDRAVDTMALAARYTFPMKLEKLCLALNSRMKKNPEGKSLIEKLTIPNKKTGEFNNDPKLLKKFYQYCMDDVDATYSAVKALPHDTLSPEEHLNWRLTFDMNMRGLPVDVKLAAQVQSLLAYYKKIRMKEVPDLCDDAFQSVTQRAALLQYCWDQGVELPNLQAATVTHALEHTAMPTNVYKLLRLRQEFALSSVAKFEKIRTQAHAGRVYGNLYYYGAGTGRLTGRGFQAHNLPRATVSDVDTVIDRMYSDIPWVLNNNPTHLGKCLVRATIKAPEGMKLGVADYASIENRILAWAAGQWDMVELHRKGLDEYRDFAKDFFGISYEDVNSKQRQFSKPIVLGAGFCLAWKGLISYAQDYGVDMTDGEAQLAIKTYRARRKKVVKFWEDVQNAALSAVQYENESFVVQRITFRAVRDRNKNLWLSVMLPSKRALLYFRPEVGKGLYGPTVYHYGTHPKTKQWCKIPLARSRIVENIVQGTARDVMCNGIKHLCNFSFRPILSVHDEIICELEEKTADVKFAQQKKLMCIQPAWAPDLPINADGAVLNRYAKI